MANGNPCLGSIGDSTSEDIGALASDFADALKRLVDGDRDTSRRRAARNALRAYASAADSEADLASFVEGEGLEALESYCPPYVCFHADADGRFGFWPDLAMLEQDARCRNGVLKLSAGSKWPRLGDDISYVLEVSDHGNVTLYSRPRREVWSCV